MAKLRDDLVGVVYIDGKAYGAGEDLPDGVSVSSSLTAPEAPAEAPARKRGRPRKES